MPRKSLHSSINKLSYKSLFIILFFLLISIVVLWKFVLPNHKVSAAWWDDGWNYRKAVSISNTSGSNLTDFQISVSIGTSALIASGKMQSDCDDIRVTDINGNLLPYWIETNGLNACNQANSVIWVKTTSLPTSDSTLYLYYGNPSANSTSNGNNVFIFFDDFNNSTIDTNKWKVSGSMLSISGNRLRADRANGTGSLFSKNTFPRPFVLDYDFYPTQYPSGWEGSYHGTISFGTYNTSYQTEHAWIPHGGGGNSYCGLCDDGGCYHGSIVNPLSVGNTLYKESMQIQSLISGPQGVIVYSNRRDDNTGSQASGTAYTAATTGNDPLYIGVNEYGGNITDDFEWDNWRVRKYTSTEPTITLQSEEVGGGPIAYWKFDEGAGTSALNSANGSNAGTITGATWQTEDQCISGKCLKFNGSTNFINTGIIPSLSTFSLGAWIKAGTDISDFRTIIDKTNSMNDRNFWLALESGTGQLSLRFSIAGTSATYLANTALNDNKWHYVTATYDNSYVKLYVDGKLNMTPVSQTGIPNTGAVNSYIGDQNGTRFFNGLIDDVKIYPYARTADQIKQDYNSRGSLKGTSANLSSASNNSNLSDGLVGYWKMDEGVGTTTTDSSGNNITGTFSGSTLPDWSSGKYGVGVSFNGVNNYIDIGNSSPIRNFTNQITVSVWAKYSAYGGGGQSYSVLAVKGTPWTFLMENPSNKIRFRVTAGGQDLAAADSQTHNLNQWYHFVGTYDGQNIKMYKDGMLVGTTPATGNLGVNDVSAKIGTFTGTTYNFNGLIDEVRIYNRALSSTEVYQLYEYAPEPLFYWDFNEGVGTTAFDKQGHTNLPITNATYKSGKYGGGLNFNGNAWLEKSISPSIAAAQDYTQCLWFNTSNNATRQVLIDDSNQWEHWIAINTNKTVVSCYYNTAQICATSTNTINLNTWNYVCSTYKAGQSLDLFVNGTPWATNTNVGTSASKIYNDVCIGKAGGGSNDKFTGSIDDVKIYNYARTQKQIIEDMNAGAPATSSKFMIAYYKFDEGSGTTANNSGNGGSALNGTFGTGNSAPTWSNDGKFGKALSFNGVSSNIILPNDIVSVSSIRTSGVTYSTWIKTNNSTEQRIFGQQISNGYSDYSSGGLGISSGKAVMIAYDDAGSYKNSSTTTTIQSNKWYHIVGTYNPADQKIRIYLNGNLEGTPTSITTFSRLFTNASNRIGRKDDAYPFNGLIDEVKIYNYALTDNEIKQDYNQGSALQMGQTSQTIGGTTTSLEYCIPGDTTYCDSPVAEWNFEENTGTTTKDSSGNNNTGTFGTGNSAPTWTVGKKNTSAGLKFDGVNDFVNINNNTNLNPGTGNFTVSMWLKVNPGAANYGIVTKDFTTGYGVFYTPADNSLGLYIQSGANANHISILNNYSKWIYVTWTVDNTNDITKSYLNGVFNNQTNYTIGDVTNTSPLNIGKYSPGANHFNGQIDDVRIYNYIRTPAQIAYDYNKGGPIAWWKLDECQGSVANDSSGIGNTGSISIGASGTQTSVGTCTTSGTAWGNGASGHINSSLNFDGTDDYVDCGDINQSDSLANITVSAWVYSTNFNQNAMLVIKHPVNSVWELYLESNAIRWRGGGTAGTLAKNLPSNNQWHNITVTQVGTLATMFVDGINKGSAIVNALGSSNLNVNIGKFDNTYYFNGKIDDVRIYNYALNPEQVKTLYNGGAVSFN